MDVDSYHVEMMKAIQRQRSSHEGTVVPEKLQVNVSTTTEVFERPDEAATAAWAPRFYHTLQDFLEFFETSGITSSVRSVVVLTQRMLEGKLSSSPHDDAPRDWRYPAAAAFWQHMFSLVDPDRVLLIAPPTELACLTNAAIDTFGDWYVLLCKFILRKRPTKECPCRAFGDMDFHILELRQERKKTRHLTELLDYSKLSSFPPQPHSFARSSLLHFRPWTHVSLNEGSFLKAYGTYEFFERGPPSLVYSIKQCLEPVSHHGKGHMGARSLPKLCSFTYTAIFPFSNHADFVDMLPHLEELDLQLAPDPQSGILDDKERIGKAQLQDCWQELLSAYHDLAMAMNTFRMSRTTFEKLKNFVCRDSRIPALREELDEVFTPLCLPVWVEAKPGEFDRVAMSPQLSGIDYVA